MRSLTSGKVLGRVKISPEKGTPIEDRVGFNNDWYVGAEHGLVHDGLQADGSLEVRLDWRDSARNEAHVAIVRVNPWLAYGCGEGARLAVRKPGATEGTAATVQRTLRDDTVVLRRDGAEGELTVDPTPFTVVTATNPRHPPGTRLLLVHEGSCVDAVVEPWPTMVIEVKEGSRHELKVNGKHMSGWITLINKNGDVNVECDDDEENRGRTEADQVWHLTRRKELQMTSGCDSNNSEKTGKITKLVAMKVLERRETEDQGVRAYVATIPGQSATVITCALNEFNHSVQRFPSVAEYEAARANYLEDIVVREALVEDAITGNNLRIKDQTLHISTATDPQDNCRPLPTEWKIENVLDLVRLLLVPSPNRVNGCHSTQPVLVRAGPGTGKTWMAKQAVFTLADRLLRGTGPSDGIRLVPIVVFVQRIIYLLRETMDQNKSTKSGLTAAVPAAGETPQKSKSLLERYIASVYSGKKMEAWCTMLMQAYDMRALVVLLDGVDEAAGLRDHVEHFVHKEVVPSGNRVLVTSRPEGVRLETYAKTFVVMNLCTLTNEQQRRVINIQMEGNVFFDHLLSLGEVRKNLDDAYKKISANIRSELEALWSEDLFHKRGSADGQVPQYDPEQRQKIADGSRIVAVTQRMASQMLRTIDQKLKSTDNACKVALLDRIDTVIKNYPIDGEADTEGDLADKVLEDMLTPTAVPQTFQKVAIKLGVLLQKERKEYNAQLELDKAKGKASKERVVLLATALGVWENVVANTDEIYCVHESMQEPWVDMIKKIVLEMARDDEDLNPLGKGITFLDMLDPATLYDKARELYADRFKDAQGKLDGLAEACVEDVARCRVLLQTGTQIKDFITRLSTGIDIYEGELTPVKPSQRADQAAKEVAREEMKQRGEALPPVAMKVQLMHLQNKFEELDPTHFRSATCSIKMTTGTTSIFGAIEVHYNEIFLVGNAEDSKAYKHYNYFRKKLKGTVPEKELDTLLEEKLIFLVDATGVPVLLSLLVLIFTAGGEDLTKLPSNRIELYELGIQSAIAKRLLPGGRTSTDSLMHDWLRLFNLDRSSMMTTVVEGITATTEKKEREHRPTRKAALSQEHNFDAAAMATEANAEKEAKKKISPETSNQKDNKKLLNLDSKEVYEVFRHGAHYLREAAKPEVQRTELNRIELAMPKKLVDTVMMLVNANLKMLLGDRARAFGLTMLRHVAVSNQLAGRREFSAIHVAHALLVDNINTEGLTLWLHLNKEDGGLPLTKTLEAQTELAPAQYQFKHLSFQEGLFAQHLLIRAEAGWEGWETDLTASEFLNNPFMNNPCRIAAGYLGTLCAKRRPIWDFSEKRTRLTEPGLQALWLICEQNESLQKLNLMHNGVGIKHEDATGMSRMLLTSTALQTLNLGSNSLGELKQYIRTFARGLGANKTLTMLDVSNNHLLPEGIKHVCTALRTCTAMRELDLSYNSPGRELALPQMLQMHPCLRSIGVVEKEPTTRSERTWWLDTRGKEAIGRALLDSPSPEVQFLQCDVFSLTASTETLNWTSKVPCDAIVLAGVLRANSTLKTLNISNGDIGDYEREEIGNALVKNLNGRTGYCDAYGLKENGPAAHPLIDLKEKDVIRTKRSFSLFAGLLRANRTITSLTLSALGPEYIDVLAEALATNTTMQSLRLEQPSKAADTQIATLPVQQLNGALKQAEIDLSLAGGDKVDGSQPMHRHACGVVGAILAANSTISRLKINPGGGSEGGSILEHIHRARKSSLATLDLTGIGLAERGGSRIFETLLAGKCGFLKTIHIGSNALTDLAVGQLLVDTFRSELCNISTLDIHDNQIGAGVVCQAIKYNRSLTNLDIRKCPIDDEGLGNIGVLLLLPECPCHLRYISCDAFEINDGETELKIRKATLGPGETRLLCGVFKWNNLIKDLNLSGRGIECDAATVLATALLNNTTLKSLDLSNNPISTVSNYTGEKPYPITGLNALADAVNASQSLDAITLEGGKLPVFQLKGDGQKQKVRLLDLSRKSLSFVSSIFMGTLLRGNTYINELVLHSNELTPTGATIVVKQLSRSLKSLDITNIVLVEGGKDKGKGGKDKSKGVATAAKLVEFPPEQLTELWAAVSQLSALEKLTMDKDFLRDLSSIGRLLSMKFFSASNNKLSFIPADIQLIRGLKSLTLNGNQLRELNPAVGELENIEKIDLRSNQLTFLPTSLAKLRLLKQLDASENLIQTLHPSICDLHAIEKLELKENPLARPPASVARLGLPGIRKYFQEITMTFDICAHGARLVLLGAERSGKTTLERALRAGIVQPPSPNYEPTNDMDINAMVIGPESNPTKQVWLSTWDMAGSVPFDARLAPYYVDGSIFVLTVAAGDTRFMEIEYEKHVGRWLSEIQMAAPQAIVLPIITKCDTIHQSKDTSPTAVANAAQAQVAWLKGKLQQFQSKQLPGGLMLRIQMDILCVSAVTDYASTVEEVKKRIEGMLFTEPPLVPGLNRPINRTMVLTTVFLRALRDGRDPIDSARATDLGYIPSTMSTDLKPVRTYMEKEELVRIYAEEFVPALKIQLQSDAASALTDAITLLTNQGECCFAPSGIVYLQPDAISRFVKPLCDSRVGNRLWLTREYATQDALRALYTGLSVPDAERSITTIASDEFSKKGLLHEELLPCMWESTFLKRDEYGVILRLLCSAGLFWLAENTSSGRKWLMPMRLPVEMPDNGYDLWNEGLLEPATETLKMSINLGPTRPPGVFERFVALCYGIGMFKRAWRRGVHIEVDEKFESSMHVRHVLLELRPKEKGPDDEGKETKYELSISAIAWKKSRAPTFAFMKQLQGLAASAIADVPGLRPHGQASFCCPGCMRLKLAEASWYSVDETSSKKLTCDKCSEVIELNKAPQLLPLNLGRYLGMPLNMPVIAKWENYGIKDLKVTSDKMRLGRPLESQVSLYKQLGLKTSQTEDKEDIELLKSLTEQSIFDEITAKARELGDKSPTDAPDGGKGGWTDLDWLLYITAPSAKEAVQRKVETNGEESSEATKMANERIKLQRQAKERGLDAGRADSSLDWFLKRPVIVAAGLSRAHVLALRLYASSVFRRINAPLYNGCSAEKPHWYPSTVLLLSDALGKLRNAQVEQRRTANAKAAALAEDAKRAKDSDDADLALKAATLAKDAATAAAALKVDVFWRGVSNLTTIDFKLRGGSELAFMSFSKSREVAQQQALERALAERKAREVVCTLVGKYDPEEMTNGEEAEYLTLYNFHGDRGKKKVDPSEIPIVLFKLHPGEAAVPCDLSFLSPTPDDAECVYPPGVYLEQRKEATEYLRLPDGTDMQGKIVECQVHLYRPFGPKGKKSNEETKAAEASAEAKPAEAKPAEGKPAEGKPAEGKPAK